MSDAEQERLARLIDGHKPNIIYADGSREWWVATCVEAMPAVSATLSTIPLSARIIKENDGELRLEPVPGPEITATEVKERNRQSFQEFADKNAETLNEGLGRLVEIVTNPSPAPPLPKP